MKYSRGRTAVKWLIWPIGTRIRCTLSPRDAVRAQHKKKTMENPVWFLERMKCPTVKSSGELSSVPIFRLHLFYPLSPSLPSRSRSTSNLNHRGKRSTPPLCVCETLNLHDGDIYLGYALIRQELPSMYPISYPGTASSWPVLLIPIWRSSSLWTSAFTTPSAFGDSHPLSLSSSASRKNFCRVRVSWRISCYPAVLHREIMARPLTLAHRYFIASLSFRDLSLWNLYKTIISLILFFFRLYCGKLLKY